jgi:hypothetical protein
MRRPRGRDRARTDTLVARLFGNAGDQVAGLYRALLDSYWQQRRPQPPGFERQFMFHDLRLGFAIERLLTLIEGERAPSRPFAADRYRIVPADNGTRTQLDALIRGTERSAALRTALLVQARQLRSSLAAARRPFFDDLNTRPATLLFELDRAAAALARASIVSPPRLVPTSWR